MKLLYISTIWASLALSIVATASAQDLPPPASEEIDFARHIAPLLTKHCNSCHGAEKQESGLRLDGSRGGAGGWRFGQSHHRGPERR